MTGKQIQEIICKSEVLKLNIPCENVRYLFNHEVDVLSLNKSGYLTEFEVKVSRSDFKADLKKEKWEWFDVRLETQIPNYFIYSCIPELIIKEEIPSFAGLVYVTDEGIEVVKKPKLLHKFKKPQEQILSKFAKVFSERIYLGSCRMTYDQQIRKEGYRKYQKTITIYN